jgi:hypothetical protein
MSELRTKNITVGTFDAVVKMVQSPEVTLELLKKIFFACFTAIDARKDYWFETIAKEIIAENCITFVNSGDDGKDGIRCVATLVFCAVPNSRRPFMKGANRGNNLINMSTRRSKTNIWTARPVRKVPHHEFSYEKIDGWEHLIKWDPEAKKIYDEHHPKETVAPNLSSGGTAAKKPESRSSATMVSHDHSLATTLPPMDAADMFSMFDSLAPSDGSAFLDEVKGPNSLDNDSVSSVPVRMKRQGASTDNFWVAAEGMKSQTTSLDPRRVLPQREFIVNAHDGENHGRMLSDMSSGTEVSCMFACPPKMPCRLVASCPSHLTFLCN